MINIRVKIILLKIFDFLLNECVVIRLFFAWALLIVGFFVFLTGKKLLAFGLFERIHSSGFSKKCISILERWIRLVINNRNDCKSIIYKLSNEFICKYCSQLSMSAWIKNPFKLIGSRIFVVKSRCKNEKGVVVIDYSYVFPLFMLLFDVKKITEKYYIVLEPSWTGFFNLEILSYATLDVPIFIQVSEPRDAIFIDSLKSNLISVPIAANWWVDHRTITPDTSIKKDIDLIMIASWSKFKRHWSFFECLLKLRKQGIMLTVTLVGYPGDINLNEIKNMASEIGVIDQIEFFECLSPENVNKQLNRSKALILWSRKEGFNRAIIEAMLADLPVIIRDNFNYGYKYPYINDKTGVYATESNFGEIVTCLLLNLHNYSPREWIMSHMTCQHATDILQEKISRISEGENEKWTRGITVKTGTLNSQKYWNEEDRKFFNNDYEYIASCMRSNFSQTEQDNPRK